MKPPKSVASRLFSVKSRRRCVAIRLLCVHLALPVHLALSAQMAVVG